MPATVDQQFLEQPTAAHISAECRQPLAASVDGGEHVTSQARGVDQAGPILAEAAGGMGLINNQVRIKSPGQAGQIWERRSITAHTKQRLADNEELAIGPSVARGGTQPGFQVVQVIVPK